MVTFPNCKINLGLRIFEKRADGFHNMESVFFPVPWKDVLEILPAKEFSFHVTGLEIDSSGEENLCVKAYQLLQKQFKLPPVYMHLHKVIPMGAGLGGGSGDAAFTLKMLDEIFELKLTEDQLKNYAAQLGSDCPFFIVNKPVLATGRGEQLITVDGIETKLKNYFLVIAYPDIKINTAKAFKDLDEDRRNSPWFQLHQPSLESDIKMPVREWMKLFGNDFEPSVGKMYTIIAKLKEKFYRQKALFASLTGSGSAVYALFEQQQALKFPEGVKVFTTQL